jgi:tRNA1Val (adenine37-N6)-methyltransferase
MAPGDPADDEVTYDTLLRGRVGLYQPVRGFRTSLDPVWLASFVAPPFGRFVDIGCGSGAVSFLLLARDPSATGVGVELQPRLAALAARGAARNGFESRFDLRVADVRTVSELGRFDLVVTNPPYRPLGTGNLPPDRERSIANHEVSLTLAAWLDAAAGLMAPSGRVAVVFPADRLDELHAELQARDLVATRQRLVVPQLGERPGRVLLEARREGSLQVEPPLVVHEGGRFTPEVERMVSELG